MDRVLAFEPSLSRFRPLEDIICYDDFDKGPNGWVDLTPNFKFENFEPRKGPIDLTRWGPVMLSTASFSLVGTHGSMDGIYSLKLSTRPVAGPYEEKPVPGSMGHAIKRLSMHQVKGLIQYEMWFAYKPEQDRIGFSEKDIRAFGVMLDLQDNEYRYMPAIRYVNSVNGELKQFWQYSQAADVTDEEWEYGKKGWCVRGIDPQWFGKRYADGRTDGFQEVPDGAQKLCYNESDDKINWLYFRFLFDNAKREYVEFQSGDRTFDLRGKQPTLVKPYANISGLFNPVVWIETDTNRRAFMFIDSIVISVK